LGHESIHGEQASGRRNRPNSHRLGWDKEGRDDGEREEDRVNRDQIALQKGQAQDEYGANQVTGDHGAANVPLIHVDAGKGADKGQRQHVRHQDQADLGGGAVEMKYDYADDCEDGEEVAENADNLCDPDATHSGNSKHFTEAELGRRTGHESNLESFWGFGHHSSPAAGRQSILRRNV